MCKTMARMTLHLTTTTQYQRLVRHMLYNAIIHHATTRSNESNLQLTLVLRFYFYAHVLRLGVKKSPHEFK